MIIRVSAFTGRRIIITPRSIVIHASELCDGFVANHLWLVFVFWVVQLENNVDNRVLLERNTQCSNASCVDEFFRSNCNIRFNNLCTQARMRACRVDGFVMFVATARPGCNSHNQRGPCFSPRTHNNSSTSPHCTCHQHKSSSKRPSGHHYFYHVHQQLQHPTIPLTRHHVTPDWSLRHDRNNARETLDRSKEH